MKPLPQDEFMLRIVLVFLLAVAFCLLGLSAALVAEHAPRRLPEKAGNSVRHDSFTEGFDDGYNDWVCPFVYPTPYAWDTFWFGPVNGAIVERFRYLNEQYCRSDVAPVT